MTNWRTSLTSYALAALNLSANGVTLKQALVSAAIALLGTLAKDAAVHSTPPAK